MIHQIKNIKRLIISLLKEKQEYRDDDNKLIARVWFDQTTDGKGNNITRQTTAHDFLLAFREGQYTSPESIRRCRQKVQEQNEDLRGASYKNRKNKGVEIRTEIHAV